MLRLISLLGLLLTISFGAQEALGGTTYYVHPEGDDTNPGTEELPWKTINYAATQVQAGDTVLICPGTYTVTTHILIETSGEEGNPITFKGYGSGVVVDGSLLNGSGWSRRDAITINYANYIIIENLEIKKAYRAGIEVIESDYVTIRNVTSHDNGTWGIFTAFSNHLLLENNECYGSRKEHGIYVSNSGDYPTVRGNVIHHNYTCGLHMNADISMGDDGIISYALVENNIIYSNGLGGSAINCDGVTDSVIRNNLLYETHASGISLYQIDGGAQSNNNIVCHNTIIIASDGRWAINLKNGSSRNKIYNNILLTEHSWRGSLAADSIEGLDSDYNVFTTNANAVTPDDDASYLTFQEWQALGYDQHSIQATIKEVFVDRSQNNYHLNDYSPCIGAGIMIPDASNKDIEGNPRPNPPGSNPDIGAYEHERDVPLLMLSISGVSPNVGPLAGGTRITITGMGFVVGATVTIGSNSATDVTVVSDTKITAKTPAGTAGIKDVVVTNPDSLSATLKNGFFYATLPRPGDVSGDGKISAYDAALILRYVVGLIDHFPVEDITSPSAIMPRNYVVRVPEQTAKTGDRIYVPIVIDDVTGILAGGISVKYDPTILKALNVVSQTLFLNGAYSKANISKQGEVRFAFATTEAMNGQGNLFMVEFEVLPDNEGRTSPLILDSVSLSNSLNVTKINGSVTVLPQKSALLQNYPNPFNPETWIPFKLAQDAPVVISIYNQKGQLTRAINLGLKKAGIYMTKDKAAYWDGKDSLGESVASGVYFYTLHAGEFRAMRKMVIIK